MLTEKRFRLRVPILADSTTEGCREAVPIPVGATLSVVSGPNSRDRKVYVLWNYQAIVMSAYDLHKNGTIID
jgi:hypothetical protein